MDRDLIEKYKNELMKMYRTHADTRARYTAAPAVPDSENPKVQTPPTDSTQPGFYVPGEPSMGNDASDTNGRLVAIVTALSYLYPVPNARVTIFTGPYENMQIVATDTTNESGRTKIFELPAPSRELSMQSGSTEQPYSLYNMLIEADGFVSNLHLNIPVFRGVTSLQRSNLLPVSAAGNIDGPIIYNEYSSFNL